MPAPLRVVGFAASWIVFLGGGWSAAVQAQEAPLVVTYGPAASTAEGDPDFREVIFLSVPDGLKDRLYLRVFDPDTGGEHDLVYDAADDTQVRFTLFGGEGAYTGVAGAGVEPGAEQLAAGTTLGEQVVAASAALDDRWQTLFSVTADQGEAVGGRRIFRLQVEGVSGDDANLYGATLSLRDRRPIEDRHQLVLGRTILSGDRRPRLAQAMS